MHEELCKILGSRNVYFNPPSTLKMKYPAIVYNRKIIENVHANNGVYIQSNAYEVTVIDGNVESETVTKVSRLSKCKHDRNFKSGDLDHNVFTLYY